jgi:hypothetical protein
VSCASAGNCTAVGFYRDNSNKTQGLLLSETGGLWGTGVEASLPADASTLDPNVEIISVSCASAGNCSAVGGYNDNAGNAQGVLLTETGGAWAPGVEAGLPAGASTSNPNVDLTAVSCGAPGSCTAVGSYNDNSNHAQVVIFTETAGVWGAGVQAAPPAGAGANPNAEILSVSCPSVGNCSAVGDYQDASGAQQGLLLGESGGTWATGTEAGLPANAGSNPLAHPGSVSCASAGNCTAVGTYRDSSGKTQGLLLSETGGSWAPGVEATLPTDAATANAQPFFYSVSCASAGTCAAVGYYFDLSGNQQGLLVSQAAGVWASGAKASLPPGVGSVNPTVALSSVSCVTVTHCAAVGRYSPALGDTEGLLLDTAPASSSLLVGAPAGGSLGKPLAPGGVTATLAGGLAPVGAITFTVFGPQPSPPATCESGAAFTVAVNVSGNGAYHPSAAFTPPRAGDYWWHAAYSGDLSDNPAASACGAGMPETIIASPVEVAPSIRFVGAPRASAGAVTFVLGCSAPAGHSCQTTDTLTSVETLKRGRPVKVSAGARARTRTVVVGSKRVSLPAGASRKITIALNGHGRSLLARFGKLPVTLTVSLARHAAPPQTLKRRLTLRRKVRRTGR